MEQTLSCPRCGSSQLTANKKGFSGRKAAVGAILTGGIGLLAGTLGSNKVKITCLACGHSFRPGQGRIVNEGSSSSSSKQSQSTNNQSSGCLGMLVIGLIVWLIVEKGCSCNNNEPISNTSQQVTLVELTKTDSLGIRKKLERIYIFVDSIDYALLSPLKKYVTVVTNNLNPYEKKYETTKNTRTQLQNAKKLLFSIDLPENLPENIKNSLLTSFSTIGDYYSNLITGIDIDIENKLRFLPRDMPFGDQEDYNKMQEAADAIDGISKMLIDFGTPPNSISKMTHHKK